MLRGGNRGCGGCRQRHIRREDLRGCKEGVKAEARVGDGGKINMLMSRLDRVSAQKRFYDILRGEMKG